MPKLEAIQEIRYGGKTHKPGETFEVREKDVRILKAIKKAKDAAPEAPKTQRRPRAEAKVTEEKPAETPLTDGPFSLGSGTYRRRDMKSED